MKKTILQLFLIIGLFVFGNDAKAASFNFNVWPDEAIFIAPFDHQFDVDYYREWEPFRLRGLGLSMGLKEIIDNQTAFVGLMVFQMPIINDPQDPDKYIYFTSFPPRHEVIDYYNNKPGWELVQDVLYPDNNCSPAPEPSSILLGLMSMSSMFALRKRKSVI